jgi:hypothetical protein
MDGRELWRLKSGGDNPIPTPFGAQGFIYVANGHGAEAPLWAIRPYAFIAWSEPRSGAYIQTGEAIISSGWGPA